MNHHLKITPFQAILMLLALTLFASLTVPAAANGVPVKIFLNYLPEYSTFGPTDATGIAVISIGEAWLDLTAENVPQLTNEKYEAWISELGTDRLVSLGKFSPTTDGHVIFYAEYTELPHTDYRYFFITVEADPDLSPEPDARRFLAGVFPDPKLEIIYNTPTPTLEPGVTVTPGIAGTPGAPVTLPVTGVFSYPAIILMIVGGLSIVTGAGIIKLKRK